MEEGHFFLATPCMQKISRYLISLTSPSAIGIQQKVRNKLSCPSKQLSEIVRFQVTAVGFGWKITKVRKKFMCACCSWTQFAVFPRFSKLEQKLSLKLLNFLQRFVINLIRSPQSDCSKTDSLRLLLHLYELQAVKAFVKLRSKAFVLSFRQLSSFHPFFWCASNVLSWRDTSQHSVGRRCITTRFGGKAAELIARANSWLCKVWWWRSLMAAEPPVPMQSPSFSDSFQVFVLCKRALRPSPCHPFQYLTNTHSRIVFVLISV